MDHENLAADIGRLEGSIEVLEAMSRNLDSEMEMLGHSWKGEAAVEYFASWCRDREKLEDIIATLKQLLSKMKYAESSYRAAGQRSLDAVGELMTGGE